MRPRGAYLCRWGPASAPCVLPRAYLTVCLFVCPGRKSIGLVTDQDRNCPSCQPDLLGHGLGSVWGLKVTLFESGPEHQCRVESLLSRPIRQRGDRVCSPERAAFAEGHVKSAAPTAPRSPSRLRGAVSGCRRGVLPGRRKQPRSGQDPWDRRGPFCENGWIGEGGTSDRGAARVPRAASGLPGARTPVCDDAHAAHSGAGAGGGLTDFHH